MISGLTIANVVGVPLGTFICQAAGWRTAFLVVAGIGTLTLLGLVRFLSSIETARDLGAKIRVLKAPAVWLTLTVSTLASTSMFAFFTFVTPILTHVAGVTEAHVGFVLLAVGIGLTAGNFLGARLADWRAGPSLIAVLIGVAIVMATFAGFGRTFWSALAVVTL
ncbi:putative MFS family arabinose efflux permease [Rhizobium sp. SORGH_AS 787]|nr:putative MFS family arabinose efflux permease [Rhizobium sp. SORGH_AS_0787]